MTNVEHNLTRKDFQNNEPRVGDEVFYSLEDYDTGEDIIYKGKITKIFMQDVTFIYANSGKETKTKKYIRLYQVADGLAMQRNAFYTIDELFKMREKLEEIIKNGL